jgi:hypothetical protein
MPVKLVSRPGSDFRAKCGVFTASCTASAEGAMRTAAAKAMNASGKPMIAAGVTVSAADMEIVGEGRECMARYYLGKEARPAGRPTVPLVITLALLKTEVFKARSKFPSNEHLFAALLEEVGELAHEMTRDRQRQREEALQVACVAIRIAEEGDADFGGAEPCAAPLRIAGLTCDAERLGSAARALLEGGPVTHPGPGLLAAPRVPFVTVCAQDFADVVQAAEQTVSKLIRDGKVDYVASLAVAFLAKEAEERIAAETEKAEIHREGAKEGRA